MLVILPICRYGNMSSYRIRHADSTHSSKLVSRSVLDRYLPRPTGRQYLQTQLLSIQALRNSPRLPVSVYDNSSAGPSPCMHSVL